MNKRFNDYLSSLTPRKRDLAQEAISEFLKGESDSIQKVRTAAQVYNLCHDLNLLDTENFEILLLNHNHKLIKRETISKGGLTETTVDIRIIMRECLLNNATILICVHNHPSGSISPSRCDDELTMSIKKAADIMRIYFADHVIIGAGAYYSYRESGKI